jgi:CheY-like chemotaxis protein
MSIRRTRPRVQKQHATGPLDRDNTRADIDWNIPDRGLAGLSRDQTQLDDDREFANPTDLGNAARLQKRQRDIDGRRDGPKGAGRELTTASPTAESPHKRADELAIPVQPVPDGRPRLIIADDDPVVRSMLEMSLRGRFDVVGTAADSDDAVELARATQPDAAIIDVEMPKGGGLSAVRGILDVAPATAIVVLSGDESDTVVRELMQAGAMAYLRKGSAPQALADSLTESVEAHAHWGHNAASVATSP